MPLHPVLVEKLQLLQGIPSMLAAHADPALRQRLMQFTTHATYSPPSMEVREESIDGPHGAVALRVYVPAMKRSTSTLVWVHGGAWRAGDLDSPEADWVAREVADRSQATVVSADYRLALNGVSYPVPLDDVVAAIRWVRRSAAALGGDASRVVVGGASAGANLAAGASVKIRDEDSWIPWRLALAVPTMHATPLPNPPALAHLMQNLPPLLRFSTEAIAEMNANYLGCPISSADGYAFPALANLAGLPATLVITAEYDDLRPSGEAFTEALARAGVDVRQAQISGVPHGFLNMTPTLDGTIKALNLLAETLTS
jgi:acetyl esterase